jgi:hypothetical protein
MTVGQRREQSELLRDYVFGVALAVAALTLAVIVWCRWNISKRESAPTPFGFQD